MTAYTVANVKTTRGMEGYGYTATLKRDGKKVAEIADFADGGEVHIAFFDFKSAGVMGQLRRYDDTLFEKLMTPEEKLFNDYVNQLPKYKCAWTEVTAEDDGMRFMSSEIYVENLVNDTLDAKKLKSLMAKKVVMIENNKVYTSRAFTADVMPKAIKMFAEKPGMTVLNSMAFDEAVKLYVAHVHG